MEDIPYSKYLMQIGPIYTMPVDLEGRLAIVDEAISMGYMPVVMISEGETFEEIMRDFPQAVGITKQLLLTVRYNKIFIA